MEHTSRPVLVVTKLGIPFYGKALELRMGDSVTLIDACTIPVRSRDLLGQLATQGPGSGRWAIISRVVIGDPDVIIEVSPFAATKWEECMVDASDEDVVMPEGEAHVGQRGRPKGSCHAPKKTVVITLPEYTVYVLERAFPGDSFTEIFTRSVEQQLDEIEDDEEHLKRQMVFSSKTGTTRKNARILLETHHRVVKLAVEYKVTASDIYRACLATTVERSGVLEELID